MGQSLKKLLGGDKEPCVSYFRRKKLLCEFNTFYDINKDGVITVEDFNEARKHICKLNGWEEGSPKYVKTQELFEEMWKMLRAEADYDSDNQITSEEWLRLWERRSEKERKNEECDAPEWLATYMWFRFNMYDRTCDDVVDVEEFCYVLEHFGIPARQSRQCFLIMTENETKKLDYDYFCQLAEEYFSSDDECALGNFISGRLDFKS
ncbi:sarcoplasmic calcium-binding proteins I, III, and IV [Ixodes scapularis]|uniref:sarcoplasmic calcium-binding proteins I, III, and IV n=1 Tax=Ixodes scapularis TaxID=6945 RepID=UPI001A9D2027|nr:sarcoplasmic calcium-binding proteins I, III, and IV [Ixodes scapularis]